MFLKSGKHKMFKITQNKASVENYQWIAETGSSIRWYPEKDAGIVKGTWLKKKKLKKSNPMVSLLIVCHFFPNLLKQLHPINVR